MGFDKKNNIVIINEEKNSYKIRVLKTNKGYKNYFYIIIDKNKSSSYNRSRLEYDLVLEELKFFNIELKAILLTHSDHTNLVAVFS